MQNRVTLFLKGIDILRETILATPTIQNSGEVEDSSALNAFETLFFFGAPIIPLIATAYEFYQGQHLPVDYVVVHFIANVFFFNTLHLSFTFFLLFFHKDISKMPRRWVESRKMQNQLKWVAAGTLIFSILMAVPSIDETGKITLTYILALLTFHHGWSQYNGLWKVVNSSRGYALPDALYNRLFRWSLFLVPIVALTLDRFNIVKVFGTFQGTCLVVAGTCLGLTLLHAVVLWLRSERGKLIQTVFSLRYLLLALAPISAAAGPGQAMIHGTEYFLFLKALNKGNHKPIIRSMGVWLFVGSLALYCLLLRNGGILKLLGVDLDSALISWLLIPLNLCTLWHFYLDRKIFRMNTPEARELTTLAISRIGKF